MATPPTFGQYGHYRGAALGEAQALAPRHQGEQACTQCHYQQVQLHDKDAHGAVPCETCHGQGQEHVLRGTKESSALVRVTDSKTLCLSCHRQLAARPGSYAQIDVEQHYARVGAEPTGTPCTACHDPHEPLYMDRDLREARLHPMVHRCRDCHQGPARDESTPRPEGHPQIFSCGYCHQPIVEDAARRAHGEVRCTTCHLFFKDSEFAGRIIRDADPRFCLLCHGAGDFRQGTTGPPPVAWPQHRDEVKQTPDDALKRCVDCHQDRIHGLGEEVSGG